MQYQINHPAFVSTSEGSADLGIGYLQRLATLRLAL
ncbi:hypothetical protein CGSMWGv0288E_04176 [Gardnerella vaginalis 0288E]|nr:hypothetical protein CGSMWGv0288E_04176 [Gardnerella vaginalis 0288E]